MSIAVVEPHEPPSTLHEDRGGSPRTALPGQYRDNAGDRFLDWPR
ncbi:hypothetical protein [Gordonia sputi]|nr:hypothetical protein [Gordonia sputi]